MSWRCELGCACPECMPETLAEKRDRAEEKQWGKIRTYEWPHCNTIYKRREWKPPGKRCWRCGRGMGHYKMWLNRVEGSRYDPRMKSPHK